MKHSGGVGVFEKQAARNRDQVCVATFLDARPGRKAAQKRGVRLPILRKNSSNLNNRIGNQTVTVDRKNSAESEVAPTHSALFAA